jgi:hypothetical protein
MCDISTGHVVDMGFMDSTDSLRDRATQITDMS